MAMGHGCECGLEREGCLYPRCPEGKYDERDRLSCCHEEYEADVNGRATCDHCGEVWYLSADDIRRERELHAAYDLMMRREEWRQRREDWIHWLAFWRRWRKPAAIDDEIPF